MEKIPIGDVISISVQGLDPRRSVVLRTKINLDNKISNTVRSFRVGPDGNFYIEDKQRQKGYAEIEVYQMLSETERKIFDTIKLLIT